MNEQELLQIQISMGTIFKQIKALPLDEYIKSAELASTLGPLLDPTLWMKKGEDLDRTNRIAKAYRICRNTIAKEFVKEGEIA